MLAALISISANASDSCFASLVETTESPYDFHREWGVRLLRDNDKAFSDPDYLNALLWAAKPGVVSFYAFGPWRTKFKQLHERYLRDFGKTDPYSLSILRFTNTGTEANNMLYDFAEFAYAERTGKKAKRANLLYFGTPYGGTFGRIAEIGVRYDTEVGIAENFQIPTPYVNTLDKTPPGVYDSLTNIETEALSFIQKQVLNDDLEIGGIFLEPITASNGLKFFRPKFLESLRVLADKLGVPIIADEIFTGGGRTGKFWAVAHYDQFRPDLLTFGKGLGLSGVASFQRYHFVKGSQRLRWRWPSWENSTQRHNLSYPHVVLDNTSRVHPLSLVQSLQIINRIHYDKLPKQAAAVGAYALEQIRVKAKQLGFENDVNGIGLLFDVGTHTKELVEHDLINDYNGRWSPPLTISTQEFDKILSPNP